MQLIARLSRMGSYYLPSNGPWLAPGQEYNPGKKIRRKVVLWIQFTIHPTRWIELVGAGSVSLIGTRSFLERRLKFESSFHSITQFKVSGGWEGKGIVCVVNSLWKIYNTKAEQNQKLLGRTVVPVTSLKGLFHMPDTKDSSEFCLELSCEPRVEGWSSTFWAQNRSKIGREWKKIKKAGELSLPIIIIIKSCLPLSSWSKKWSGMKEVEKQ